MFDKTLIKMVKAFNNLDPLLKTNVYAFATIIAIYILRKK